ncbi:MAG: hypothetical protein WBF71_09965, partial [Microthrixaceae bacterium]
MSLGLPQDDEDLRQTALVAKHRLALVVVSAGAVAALILSADPATADTGGAVKPSLAASNQTLGTGIGIGCDNVAVARTGTVALQPPSSLEGGPRGRILASSHGLRRRRAP